MIIKFSKISKRLENNLLLSVALLMLCALPMKVSAQHNTHQFQIFFAQGKHTIDSTYLNNSRELSNFDTLFRDVDLSAVSSIQISSTSSPEGLSSFNRYISVKRGESVSNYIKQIYSIPDSLIVVNSKSVDWNMLVSMVGEMDVPYKEEVVEIIENVEEETWRKVKPSDVYLTLTDSRNHQLKSLRGGVAYRYLEEYIYPQMRQSTIISVVYKPLEPMMTREFELLSFHTPLLELPELKSLATQQYTVSPKRQKSEQNRKTIFALKTNLAYLGAGVTNIGVEILWVKR